MSSKLPPLELEEEVENYQAFQETTEVDIDICTHRDVKMLQNRIRCSCGAGWQGPNIRELFLALKNQ